MRKYLTLFLFCISISILSGCQVEYDKSSGTLKVLNSGTNQESHQNEWKEVKEGLSYTEISIQIDSPDPENSVKNLMLVKIDPKRYSFSIYENRNPENAKTIEEIHNDEGSLLSFNGQFFTEDFRPTGLLMSDGKELRPHSNANLLNGILAIDQDGYVHFIENPNALEKEKYSFAIQNGPILIGANGEIQIREDTGKTSSRTAIGLDSEGNIILIILKQSLLNFDNSVTLYQFAHILKEDPQLQKLQLHSILNLDGGTSTGLMIDNKYYPEMEKVQNVVLVKKR